MNNIKYNLSRIAKYMAYILIVVFVFGCKTSQRMKLTDTLFPVQEDRKLGLQVKGQIGADTKQFPVLPENKNKEIYKYIRGIKNKILRTGIVEHTRDFDWEVVIIDDDKTLNAFCTPGGYIYVYTGLIKYLDSEDQLAGVLGHEIGHAALRHSTRQMIKLYGAQTLISIASGAAKVDNKQMQELGLGLINLRFSRGHEREADHSSVRYLAKTDWNAAGAAGFFEKIQNGGGARPPQFISTHPDPGNRVKQIKADAKKYGGGGGKTYKARYEKMKKLL